jgi:4-hydroxy-3-polyprenylbenzoate decarboxylase
MFNKMMIVLEDDVDIHNPESVIESIFKNAHFPDDVIFSRGPMDVLDHASAQFAYGGKIGIDATKGEPLSFKYIQEIDRNSLFQKYPEIISFNVDLLKNNIPALLIAIKKAPTRTLKTLSEFLCNEPGFENISVLVFCEAGIEMSCYSDVVWSVLNNIDAARDCYIEKSLNPHVAQKLVIDGTRKSLMHDGFIRPWPNVTVMDEKTIQAIDVKWMKLNLGSLLKSPSLKYKKLLHGETAIAEE